MQTQTKTLTKTTSDNVLNSDRSGILQRKCESCGQHTITSSSCAECHKKRSPLQRRSTNQAEPSEVPPIVHEVLRSSGQPLDSNTRVLMESRFGQDFSQVQVHADTRAAESARAVNALAYTIGNTVVFGAGKYVPSSSKGLHLLAHELAHVVQQQHTGTGVQAEQRARTAAEQLTRGQSVASSALGGAPIGLYTAPDDGKLSESSQKGTLDLKFKPLDPSLLTLNLDLATFDKFALNSAKLPDEFKATVIKELADKILSVLQKMPEGKVVLTGHTDDTGSKDYNMNLGLERSESARQALVDAKVPEASIQIKSEGMTRKRIPTKGLEPLNRRVEVRFEGKLSSPPTQLIPPSTTPTLSPPPTAPTRPPINLNLPPTSPNIPPLPKDIEPKAPSAAVGQIKELTELIKKTSDAVRKDTLVRKLRDSLSKLQPFIPAKDAKQMIDDAIEPLVKSGSDAAIMEILKGITGKSPSTMPENRNQTGPDVPQKDLGERILQGPKIPIKDAPAPSPKLSFQYRNGPQKSYQPGAVIRFTLIPPDNFSSLQGAKRLVVVAEAERNSPSAERFANVVLESASPKTVEMQAPQKPGKYVIRVDIGLGFDYSNIQEFEVNAPQNK